jgi:hypothetical protein
MATNRLGIYLADHLAGSQTALELLARLADRYAGHELGPFFRKLRADIEEDQRALLGIADRVGSSGSGGFKRALGWVAEKLTRVKLGVQTKDRDPLALFEALEILALGITGKRGLWRALREIDFADPTLDLVKLERRADEQYDAVESRRLLAAREALRSA